MISINYKSGQQKTSLYKNFCFFQFFGTIEKAVSETYQFFCIIPLPNLLWLPKFYDMKMNAVIRFNRWWWGSKK